MKAYSRLQYQVYKKQIWGWSVVGILLLILHWVLYYYQSNEVEPVPKVTFQSIKTTEKVQNLTHFDPNILSAEDWATLGFSEKQIQTILKYKGIVGGKFSSKEQLAKCYAISDERFKQLAPYILLPDKAPSYAIEKGYGAPRGSKITVYKPFNPDDYTVADWMKLGFSERQAQSFIKYKTYLGGSFISKEKLKACYTLGPEQYALLEPYLILPEAAPRLSPSQIATQRNKNYTLFNPNDLDSEGWQNLGFTEKQAAVILNYKNKQLKGEFRTLEEIKNCFVISEQKFKELRPYIQLSKEVVVEPAKTVATDFSKIDLNEITEAQLIEFGFSARATKSYLSFRRLLGGFVHRDQILETYYIDKNLASKLLQVAQLNTSKIKKYTLKDAPESWLKKHPYFKKYADKILYYRLTYPDDKKILKFIAPEREYLEKMQWYLE